MVDTVNQYYKFQHINGDFVVTVEFNTESLEDVMMYIRGFLRACTYGEDTIKEYINE